jgi:purine-binding chemotaxis protein CheW
MEAKMSIKATGDGRVLLFYTGEHANAVSVNDVERVFRAVELVVIPDMPPHLEGLLNLRGEAVPVIDLHYRLAIQPQALDPENFFIILRHASGKIAVRSVTTPELKESEGDYSDDLTNSGACPELLKSVIKIDGTPVPVYNPEKLFQPEDAAWESLKTFWNDLLAKR